MSDDITEPKDKCSWPTKWGQCDAYREEHFVTSSHQFVEPWQWWMEVAHLNDTMTRIQIHSYPGGPYFATEIHPGNLPFFEFLIAEANKTR